MDRGQDAPSSFAGGSRVNWESGSLEDGCVRIERNPREPKSDDRRDFVALGIHDSAGAVLGIEMDGDLPPRHAVRKRRFMLGELGERIGLHFSLQLQSDDLFLGMVSFVAIGDGKPDPAAFFVTAVGRARIMDGFSGDGARVARRRLGSRLCAWSAEVLGV